MSTLGELRAGLRVLLNDGAAGGYLWSDGQLNRFLGDAVRGYGRHFPREQAVDVTTVSGQQEYALPAGCARVVRVELVDGAGGGVVLVEGGDGQGVGYEVFGGKLWLMPAPLVSGESVRVWYLGAHGALVADGDLSSVPGADEDLLLVLAAAKAMETLAGEEAKRRRFEERTGQSARSAGDGFLAEWREGVEQRGRRVRGGRLVVR